MKNKTLTSLCTILLFILQGCNSQNEDFLQAPPVQNTDTKAFLVSEQQAVKDAMAFFNTQINGALKKNNVSAKKRVVKAVKAPTLGSQKGLYVVEFENNAGYAVVSADKRDKVSVYFASSSGVFNENDGVIKALISASKEYQQSAIATYKFNPDKGDGIWIDSTVVEVQYGPLLNTCWHQGAPFNYELQKAYNKTNIDVGCVPVAIGQIANYYQYPKTLNGETLDWELISLATGKETSIGNVATQAASRLLYLTGTGIGIKYPNNTGSNLDGAKKGLSLLGYSYKVNSGLNIGIIQGQVTLRKPVYMQGEDEDGGHAWVADGYKRIRGIHRVYDYDGNLVPNTVLNVYNYDEISEYIHINFGWGEDGLFDAGYYYEYDNDIDHRIWTNSEIFNNYINGKQYSYNKNIKMIYDIDVAKRR